MKRLLSIFWALTLTLAVQASAEDQFFDSDGVQIRYVVEGEGDPLVLIHGFSATIESNWKLPGIFAPLAKEFQVIALDCRGHGKSGKPHGAENYGSAMVEDVARLLDHLEIERAHIAGYSMGGFITMRFAMSHPDRVLTAIPGGAGWSRPDDETMEGMETLAVSLEEGNGFGPLLEALTPEGQPKPTAEELAQINNMLGAMNDTKALASVIRGMGQLNVSQAELEANQVPVLAVIGGIDPLRAGVDAMDGVLNGLRIVVLEGQDHMTALSDPGYAPAVIQFVSDHSAAAMAEGSDHKHETD